MTERQLSAGLSAYDFNPGPGPLGISLFVSFQRLAKRAKCSQCQIRRVLFVVRLGDDVVSPGRCAKCAGIR